MDYISINPATGETLKRYTTWTEDELEQAMRQTAEAAPAWQSTRVGERCERLKAIAAELRNGLDAYASKITLEMGKPIQEARAEIEKCAWVSEYFAENAERFLRDEPAETDASRSYVTFQPLGTILGIMPWNFPFWQVFRSGIPALAAGNCVLLKHAWNVPQCAEAVEELFRRSDFPAGVFQWLRISHAQSEKLIDDARIHAISLTGSERAGKRIASLAGASIKKTVLELGGSDPFVVLADADLELAATTALTARFQNCGQSCVAAKRFILVDAIADEFLELFKHKVQSLTVGDPSWEETRIGPMARSDLRDSLHRLVAESIRQGAVPVLGCKPVEGPGYFYEPSILDQVTPGMPAYEEELFGPVAVVVRVRDEQEALTMANRHRYGLGASVWTRDPRKGEDFARRFQCGAAFVNGLVKSDPRVPIGGVKNSGYGRELSIYGLREFVNIKTVWIG
ncbi:NAD-dependent succinate-semialdehyde dehydrogenase [Methylocaldum szegediense]|uniref:Succinate semialdehyde dehydrogenase [NAD(P)+] Sad n=1 Tax=Methylocaldum szegediense TaxID=73780 RepID=A0ABM9I1N6_9GAMM|nr:NAD-dependent succinate-semialdehyde dehydrogenase [Methylocaldum szegediense]CAI8822477.1 Succinate semialdehyde dehydrogenase [NAD(P)+] Sad [Methylocaldum szegediense]